MEILPIVSSSSGNCTALILDNDVVLIDCGTTLKVLKKALGDISRIKAVFITHEHSDHISGLGPLSRKLDVPFYVNKLCVRAKPTYFNSCKTILDVEAGVPIVVENFGTFLPFTTKHDAAYSVGFIVTPKDGSYKLGYLTDTGFVTPMMLSNLQECDTLFLEADYDDEMLDAYEEYSDELKDRIRSNFGHLSNAQVVDLLSKLKHENLKEVIFGHLSPRSNSRDRVTDIIHASYPDLNFWIAPKVNYEGEEECQEKS